MSSIMPHYRTIQQLLSNQQFAIDEFQREYKWERKQVDELLDDLQGKFTASHKNGDELRKVAQYEEYFLGSIIVSKRDGKNYLIDGQQRVTSLTLLLIFLYREAESKDLPPAILQTLAPLIYSDNLGQLSFNLGVPERWPLLEALFHAKAFNPESGDESVRNMLARYNDIEQSDLVSTLGAALPNFIYWLLTKVGLIEIATTNDSAANEIFETMNDRGKPLSPVDMLKAFLLAPVQTPTHRVEANDVWRHQVLALASSDNAGDDSRDQGQESACIKAWFRAQYADSIRDRKAEAKDKDWELIGTPFHRWARDNKTRLGLGTEAANIAFMTKNFPFFAKASSGKRTRRGGITKTGNAHLRRIVIEAAWSYRRPPGIWYGLRRRQESISEEAKEIAWKAQHRLHKRYMKLGAAGKDQRKIVTAVARELLGFIWAIGTRAETISRQQVAA